MCIGQASDLVGMLKAKLILLGRKVVQDEDGRRSSWIVEGSISFAISYSLIKSSYELAVTLGKERIANSLAFTHIFAHAV